MATAAPLARYLQLARTLEGQIARGVLRAGDRVPSLRTFSEQQNVSITTVLQAYLWLENRGFIEARPQSGFYVKVPYSDLAPEPHFDEPVFEPTEVGIERVLHEVIQSSGDPSSFPLGKGVSGADGFPVHKLNQITASILRNTPTHSIDYQFPPGCERLRRQIAKHAIGYGCEFSPVDIVITCGAMEALNLALRAVASPGDLIAIESPTFFGVLHAIQSLGMRVIEIPTQPREGMDLEHLQRVLRKHPVRACLSMTNCQNPLGYIMPDDRKKSLVEILAKHDVPLIEDDVYGDLAYATPRPAPAKVYDRKGMVLMVSSFSKVLAPGYRVGWIHPGRYRARVSDLKYMNSLATPSLQQFVIAEFLESGGYERFLRKLRQRFSDQTQNVIRTITKYFPEGTRVSRPAGGYLLWIQLPANVSAMKLYEAALKEHVSILPGPLFSPTRGYKNHIRISCAASLTPEYDRALLTVGRICSQLAASRR